MILNTGSEKKERDDLTRHIGHDLLGPIVQRWLLGLHQYISYYDDGNTTFLHCARAGVRIHNLYELFLKNFGSETILPAEIFWTSRVAVCKGAYFRAQEKSSALIAREYYHLPISNLISGIFRHHPDILSRLDLSREEYKAHGSVFPGWIQGDTPAADAMRKYFSDCDAALSAYIDRLAGGRSRVVLIDSGWQGTMQSLLTHAFPEIKWRGLYFGRSLLPGHDASIINNVLGIMFESDVYKPSQPETAFVRHRHIIETLLEPNGPSIEEIPGGVHDAVARKLIAENENEVLTTNDALYQWVVDYLSGEGCNAGITDIHSRYQQAIGEMEKIITAPTREEAVALVCKKRSMDFGKRGAVPVVLHEKDDDQSNPDERIRNAIWQEGQVALEYEGGFARDMQLRISGRLTSAAYFDPSHSVSSLNQDKGVVAVITRTKNRPILLQRAADSVSNQTYQNYVWVIVNDGGDEDAVCQIIDACAVDRKKIILVNNARSLGMEAASNAGIMNCTSDFIVIHDDDDSWDPLFLEKTVGFLSKNGKRYGGVIAHATYVSEEIRGRDVIEHGRYPYMDWVRNVQISEMAVSNMFAPISFVFRREIWEDIGGYNEKLPVLGDWFFNMEFLLRADIGVLAVPLANYHHRDKGDSGAYSNSVLGGISKHEEFAAIARNEFVRKNREMAPGVVSVMLGYFMPELRKIRNVENDVRKIIANTAKPNSSARDYSSEDKYWVVASVNKYLLKKGSWVAKKPLDQDAGWREIEEYVEKCRQHIPVPPSFNEDKYLQSNPDVNAGVKNGEFESGYVHYILNGRNEGRPRASR